MRRTLPHPIPRRRAAATGLAGLALAGAATGALPGASSAALTREHHRYAVTVNRGVLAGGRTVHVSVTVIDPAAKVKVWWSRATVAAVVRTGVNGLYQRPYASEGYRCIPVVRGAITGFVCRLRGADVATSIRLTFAVRYRGGRFG